MYVTKLSSKGQIVLPVQLRENLDEGTAFSVIQKGDLIVLKPVPELSDEEKQDLIDLEQIWNEIEDGKFSEYSAKEFLTKFDDGSLWKS